MHQLYRKFYSFTRWKQPPVNGGAHAEQAVQDDAEKKEPRGGPCKRNAHPTGNDVSAHKGQNYVHYSNATEADGMRTLAGNPQRIAILAQIKRCHYCSEKK